MTRDREQSVTAKNRRPGWYERNIFTAAMERAIGSAAIREQRAHTTRSATGKILEVGVGSGLNIVSYPKKVSEITGLAPDAEPDHRAVRRARERGMLLHYVSGDAQAIELPDRSFDTIVCAFVLCTLPHPERALVEFARVLRPGGRLLFLEHVASPSPLVRDLQRLINPVHKVFACGCSIDRQTESILRASPLRLERFFELNLPRTLWPYRRVIRGEASAPT